MAPAPRPAAEDTTTASPAYPALPEPYAAAAQ